MTGAGNERFWRVEQESASVSDPKSVSCSVELLKLPVMLVPVSVCEEVTNYIEDHPFFEFGTGFLPSETGAPKRA